MILRDIIEHHIWANDTLLTFCEALRPEQLALEVPGTLGQVGRTLVHIVEAEQLYLSRIPETGVSRTVNDEDPVPPVAELTTAARANGEVWRSVVQRWQDGLPVTYRLRSGEEETKSVEFFVVQMLDHGAEHRNQVRTTLTAYGIEPPEIDGWTWEEAKARGR